MNISPRHTKTLSTRVSLPLFTKSGVWLAPSPFYGAATLSDAEDRFVALPITGEYDTNRYQMMAGGLIMILGVIIQVTAMKGHKATAQFVVGRILTGVGNGIVNTPLD